MCALVRTAEQNFHVCFVAQNTFHREQVLDFQAVTSNLFKNKRTVRKKNEYKDKLIRLDILLQLEVNSFKCS